MKHKETDNSLMLILSIVQTVLLLVAVIELGLILGQGGPAMAPNKGQQNNKAENMAGNNAAPTNAPTENNVPTGKNVDGYFKGNEDAKVVVVEWSDFECPFCHRFYTETMSQIESKYIETGDIKFVFKQFPLSFHAQAQKAAEASECAGEQGKFWEMHNLLFESGVEGGVTGFKQYASDLGLNTEQFNTCLDSGKYVQKIADDIAEGQAKGISGTPGFLINGKLVVGAQPYAVFEQEIEAALNA